jgi:hypothetical protein
MYSFQILLQFIQYLSFIDKRAVCSPIANMAHHNGIDPFCIDLLIIMSGSAMRRGKATRAVNQKITD